MLYDQNTVYRFRSVEALLGVHNELPRQTIYLAFPDQMNDPSEDQKNFLYGGDDIALSNLLDLYINSIATSLAVSLRSAARAPRLRLPTGFGFGDIFDITDISIGRKSELSLLFESSIQFYMEVSAESRREALVDLLERTTPPESWDVAQVLSRISAAIVQGRRNEGTEQHFNSMNPGWTGFLETAPEEFIRRMELLVYRVWVAAAFTNAFGNPRLWAQYADSHRGACLIFDKDKLAQCDSGWGAIGGLTASDLVWGEVSYGEKKEYLNFFDEYMPIPYDAYDSLMDKDGRSSKHKIDFGSSDSERGEAFRKLFRKHVAKMRRHVYFKHKHWEDEHELRLSAVFPGYTPYGLEVDGSEVLSKQEFRTIKYPIEALKGIIFGCRMDAGDRTDIKEAIITKYRSHPFSHSFAFYEAYNNSVTGDMLARPTMTGWERS